EGEDMRTILARNMTFSEDMVLHYLREIGAGLAYAHQLGIVHRDIKPANIMIDDRNRVKITDFGIAKMLDSHTTNTGTMIVGTPLYMAPEQIDGRPIDQRADIYALGIMLYELVTGTPPFHEGNIEYQHLHKPVPEITSGVSDKLKRIIYTCIEKDPDKRYQRVEDLLRELDAPA
ncbi:serine/threonine protein kinase, partial [Candidatus Sumerlaeota bacterium]|nr:serine/threonine protein kinase [Candidatus Sumerlaeota bacterium]